MPATKKPARRILVADDNEDMRDSLKSLLEQAGYQVTAVENGQAALDAQRSAPADVLITDLFMPERDGIETIEYFRAHYPQVRIIAISGRQARMQSYLPVAEVVGAHATLQKPFSGPALLEAVERV
jgi:CheY-like chemotaxis protein